MTDKRRVVVPAAAVPVAGKPFAFLFQGGRIPDCGKRRFAKGADAHVLLQAGINVAPRVDPGHQHPCITRGVRHSLPGFDAVDPLFHVGVFGQLRALQLLGYHGGIHAQGGILHPGIVRIAALMDRLEKNIVGHPAPIRVKFPDLT